MSGDWLAMGAVAALAVAGAVRRGSRAFTGRDYEVGLCGEYAVALHQAYGHPLGAVWQQTWDDFNEEWGSVLAHAFVYDPRRPGHIMDARGSRPIEAMLAQTLHAPGTRLRVASTTVKELDEQSMEGLWSEAVEQARQMLLKQAGRVRLDGSQNASAVRRVQGALTPDLLDPKRKGRGRGPRAGHCYVAAQALYHDLGGKASGYVPEVGQAPGGGTHWWLRHRASGKILDPTADQFRGYDYSQGRSTGFLTKKPSKRAQKVLARMGSGSRNDGWGPDEWSEYFSGPMQSEILRRFPVLPYVAISGRRTPPLLNTWKVNLEHMGTISWSTPQRSIGFYASPGWDGISDRLSVEITGDVAVEGQGSIPFHDGLFTGDPREDAKVYVRLITPLLCLLDVHEYDEEDPERTVKALRRCGIGHAFTDNYGGRHNGNIEWSTLRLSLWTDGVKAWEP